MSASSRGRLIWAVVTASMLFVLACGDLRTGDVEVYGIARFKLPAWPETGSNVVEVYNEMHYQPSYKYGEGPRLMPPPDSVPVTGIERRYASLEEYQELTVPEGVRAGYGVDNARRLFTVNCMVCHGPTLRGHAEPDPSQQATILRFMKRTPLPEDLLGMDARDSTDGEMFAYISNGGREGYTAISRGGRSTSPMPEFRFLLTEEERWNLVMYIRSVR